jgi:TPR repeat protein
MKKAILLGGLALLTDFNFAFAMDKDSTKKINTHDNRRDVTSSAVAKYHRYFKLAKRGDVEAQFDLGEMYYNGEIVEKDFEKSFYWYSKAAEQGNAEAQYNLGIMYNNGRGVEKDFEKASQWYLKSAEQGYAPAQYNLSIMYYNGKIIPPDLQKSFYWCSKAAEQGYAAAQYDLGIMNNGRSVEKDFRKSFYLCSKAAEQGNAEAQCELGEIYENSEEVPQDLNEALRWYLESAKQGYVKAKRNATMMCREYGIYILDKSILL